MWDWYQRGLYQVCPYFGSLTYGTSLDKFLCEFVHVLPMVFLFDQVLCFLDSGVCHVNWLMESYYFSTETIIRWYIDFVLI